MSSRHKGDRDKTPQEERDDELDAILMDPSKKEAPLKKMGLGSEENRTEVRRNLTPTEVYRLAGCGMSTDALLADPLPALPLSGSGISGAYGGRGVGRKGGGRAMTLGSTTSMMMGQGHLREA